MQLGAVYPQIELRGDPEAVRTIGLGLEDLGYDHLLAYDHVLGAVHADRDPSLMGPYTEQDPFHDPFVMFAYLAGRTQRLQFASGVIILPQRQTALVARQAADLALLSDGRFRLGVGIGWNYVEYEALGQAFRSRGSRLTEQIGLLRRLWEEPVVEFDGRFDRVDRAALLPRPTTPIPIWAGGFSEPAIRRAALLADGFIFSGRSGDVGDMWRQTQRLVEEAGRPVEAFGGERAIKSGPDPAVTAQRVHEWGEMGGTHASVITMGMGLDSAEAHLDHLGQVATALGRP